MNQLNILITTIGGLTSPNLIQALKNNSERNIFIVGTDAFEFAVGKKFVDVFKIIPDSSENEKSFINYLKKLILKYEIDVLIPCGNEDCIAVSKHRNLFNCKVLVDDIDTLKNSFDKGFVYNKIKDELGCNSPNFYIVNSYEDFLSAIKKLNFQKNKLVIKPRFGRGGRGVYVLNDNLSFNKTFLLKPDNNYPTEFFHKILKNKKNFDDLIVMEYLEQPFYSLYSICKSGNNFFTLTHNREWGNASQTFRGKVIYNKKLEKIASKIINLFNLSYTNNMEFGTSKDRKIILFDLNPRVGASSAVDADIGFNFPYQAIKLLLGEKININKESFADSKRFLRHFSHYWL